MLDRGKTVVLVIFLCALLMGSFAWWYRYQQGHRCRQLWGADSAQLIRHAPTVRLLQLAPTLPQTDLASPVREPASEAAEPGLVEPGSAEPGLAERPPSVPATTPATAVPPANNAIVSEPRADAAKWHVVRQVNISGAPGLLHGRHALVQDANYRWNDPQPTQKSQWSFALEFQAGTERTTVWFSPTDQHVTPDLSRPGARLNEAIMQAFLDRIPEWVAYGELHSGSTPAAASP
jgi:hypothetical protein